MTSVAPPATIGKTGCALADRCYAAGQLPALLLVESLRLADADLDRLTNIYRFQDGKIAERWDVVQEVPETSANDSTMF